MGIFLNTSSKIFISGHKGMVGSAFLRRFQADGYKNLIVRDRSELDLQNQSAVQSFFESEKPDFVVMAAAKVGGILANDVYRADFITINLEIQTNIISQAYKSGVKRLLFLGSSCIYPKMADQPLKESSLLTGPLEPTNDAYAIAKIAGIAQCRAFNTQYSTNYLSVMPCNLYGPGDNYHPETSHVLASLIRKISQAKETGVKEVTLWGTGKPLREFLHVDDLVDGSLTLLSQENAHDLVNVGSGKDISITELAELIADIVGYKGTFIYDQSKPDGTMKKCLDISILNQLNWQPKYSLREGIQKVVRELPAFA